MANLYDLIIIGAGPCGVTAAIYAVRNRLNVLILTKDIGGQMAWSGLIENYSGYETTTGPDLTSKFEQHIRNLGAVIKDREVVEKIEKEEKGFTIKTKKNVYNSKAVLIASGKNPKYLQVPGEEHFKNKGVVYCAICDGPLYTNKTIAIVGGGNSALDATLQMVNIAKHIYLVTKNDHMKGDNIMLEKIKKYSNVQIVYNSLTKEIKGNKVVESIVLQTPEGEKELKVDGVFVQIGLIPNSQFIDMVEKNEYGEIIIDHENRTNVPGIFAAGDVTHISEKQIIIAAGEGSKAALTIFKYIMKNN